MDPETGRDDIEDGPTGRGPLPLLAFAILALVGLAVFTPSKERPMKPAPDLLRLAFPPGAAVTEHDAIQAEVFEPDWWLLVHSMEPQAAANGLRATRAVKPPQPSLREDVLDGTDGATIHRFLPAGDPSEISRIQYFVSFGGAWIWATASPRDHDRPLDPAPVDAMVRALRLEPEPRPDRAVTPAWRAYQRGRKPGSPIAKFRLAMPPAPVLVGDPRAVLLDHGPFTHEDDARGGRQLSPEVIEFYTKDDPSGIRVDVILDKPPSQALGEPVFTAPLRIVVTCGFPGEDLPQVEVPSGEYDLSVTVVNRGIETGRFLDDAEWFDRDDLERYEIRLTPRTSEP